MVFQNFFVASGLLGDRGSLTLTFPGPSATLELWRSSSEFCAIRSNPIRNSWVWVWYNRFRVKRLHVKNMLLRLGPDFETQMKAADWVLKAHTHLLLRIKMKAKLISWFVVSGYGIWSGICMLQESQSVFIRVLGMGYTYSEFLVSL
ncbi:hypothetical protein HanHA300_Chr16g0594111 [Helianthus annuus]|nr:hypothetical protein HanHA300_Chr16g0594111 [Helianthus annuus]KAJ0440970.1 hypothetical protein HanIR_Chr16g0792481 [Helianthus annuus]KAJ0639596.1 hypothetical protein HanLR1_Chr16g0605541 [Helianthus annuus]